MRGDWPNTAEATAQAIIQQQWVEHCAAQSGIASKRASRTEGLDKAPTQIYSMLVELNAMLSRVMSRQLEQLERLQGAQPEDGSCGAAGAVARSSVVSLIEDALRSASRLEQMQSRSSELI